MVQENTALEKRAQAKKVVQKSTKKISSSVKKASAVSSKKLGSVVSSENTIDQGVIDKSQNTLKTGIDLSKDKDKKLASHVVVQTAPGLDFTTNFARCVGGPRLGSTRKKAIVREPLNLDKIDYASIRVKPVVPKQKKLDSKASPWPFFVRKREQTPQVQAQMAGLPYLGAGDDDIELLSL